ncbi:hypothetical protein KSC_055310 [Ktedonobacter sp. SOSP1-52]|nr:hypothetical protein KSC_055310 [Ktedonobacter sp. SOSP1-52]
MFCATDKYVKYLSVNYLIALKKPSTALLNCSTCSALRRYLALEISRFCAPGIVFSNETVIDYISDLAESPIRRSVGT